METIKDCQHEWELINHEEGTYRISKCLYCGHYRFQDFVNNVDRIDDPDTVHESDESEDEYLRENDPEYGNNDFDDWGDVDDYDTPWYEDMNYGEPDGDDYDDYWDTVNYYGSWRGRLEMFAQRIHNRIDHLKRWWKWRGHKCEVDGCNSVAVADGHVCDGHYIPF